MAGEKTNDVEDAEDVEEVEEASEEISKEEGRGSLLLWFAILGSPLAWVGHLVVNYSLEEWFACSPATEDRGEILGLSVDLVSLIFNSAMAIIALLSGLVAYSCWKKLRTRNGDDDPSVRARWMAFAGIVECALFLGIILLGYLPTLMLGTCETTP